MLCEECQKNEAAFSVTITSGGETTTRHLCGECMQKMEVSLTGGDISGFLSSLLSILSQSAEETDDSPVCSGCGMHYSAFERTGRLGCAQCYHDFAEQLRPVLQRIHGNIQHEGRKPAHWEIRPSSRYCRPRSKSGKNFGRKWKKPWLMRTSRTRQNIETSFGRWRRRKFPKPPKRRPKMTRRERFVCERMSECDRRFGAHPSGAELSRSPLFQHGTARGRGKLHPAGQSGHAYRHG